MKEIRTIASIWAIIGYSLFILGLFTNFSILSIAYLVLFIVPSLIFQIRVGVGKFITARDYGNNIVIALLVISFAVIQLQPPLAIVLTYVVTFLLVSFSVSAVLISDVLDKLDGSN